MKILHNVLAATLTFGISVAVHAADAQQAPSSRPLSHPIKLIASDPQKNSYLGSLVAIDGQTAILATTNLLPNTTIYVFTGPPNGSGVMTQVAELTPSDNADLFGTSIAISGNTIIVGAEGYSNTDIGAAYVYVEPAGGWTNMTETAKLTSSDGAIGDAFGQGVAINGSTIVVGAPDHAVAGVTQGAAYVFVEPSGGWTSMTQTAELTVSNNTQNASFGGSVGIDGNTLVVGAYGANTGNLQETGAAFVFVRPPAGWSNSSTPAAELSASNAANGEDFGVQTAISGNTIVVGSNTVNPGLYVFVEPSGGWTNSTETAQLTLGHRYITSFGGNVSISGDTVVAEAATHEGQGVAIFAEPAGGWTNMTPTSFIPDPVRNDLDNFGTAAISGDYIVVGAPLTDRDGLNATGEGYVYKY